MQLMKSELLLPVGNLQMALAAIHNGANAIYVGMPGFNARGRSHDHEFEELKEIIETCHLYNVHVHLAFNILIFQNELNSAIEALKKVLPLGPDALIVQDLGLVKIINEIAPDQVVHGSTQMTVTNHEAIELIDDLKIDRFVLGRENSLSEIKNIKDNTKKELEVFVHGALCVAYSGQCFTSEALGGRSANRGQCAQSCRFEYELIVDGKKKDLFDHKYLVSPKDLCGIEDIPKLLEIGIESFKVEGRLKSPEFVASVANNYRQAIDNYSLLNKDEAIKEMAITYSRGFYNGWLDGVAHQKLVDGTYGNNRGLYLGQVIKVSKKKVLIDTDVEILPGDGILLVTKKDKLGGPVYEVSSFRGNPEITMANSFDLSTIKSGDKVYLNSREKLYKELNKSFNDREKLKRIPIDIEVKAQLNRAIEIIATEGKYSVSVFSDSVTSEAKNKPLDKESVFSALKGLSHTAYIINQFSVNIETCLFINNKELKQLKQKMIAKLNEVRLKRDVNVNRFELINKSSSKKHDQRLSILVRKIEQLYDLEKYLTINLENKIYIKNIIIDYEFGKDFVKSVKLIKELGIESVIATTRILKPSEYYNFRLIERANPDGLLIRNLGALNYFKESNYKLIGDFSLNVTNSITFDYLISKGLESICVSYDLNKSQVDDLLDYVDTSKVEINVHQYMPEFHMEHCVFAAFLSEGNSFRDCGKPCEKHHVQLKDMYGNMHEIKADQECRNTMFKADSMSAAAIVPAWIDKGVGSFRFEALHETGDVFLDKIETYLKLMSGDYTSNQVLDKIEKLENYGVSTGQLLKTHKYKDRKKNVQ